MKIVRLMLILAILPTHFAFASEGLKSDPICDSGPKLIYRPEVIARISCEVLSNQGNTSYAISGRYSEGEQQNSKTSWRKKHPVGFWTLVGLGTGFTIGFAAGDDGFPFDDTVAWGNGIILGGIGAGVGALVAKTASEY